MRLKELQSPAIAAMRHPSILRKQKDWLRLSLFLSGLRRFAIRTFGAFCEARPLSRGLVSFSESGKPIMTAHPYFLLFDTAKLDRPDAAYLRSRKKLQKNFSDDKRPLFWTPQKLLVNLHYIPIYWKWKSLNSIESRLCLPKQTSSEKWYVRTDNSWKSQEDKFYSTATSNKKQISFCLVSHDLRHLIPIFAKIISQMDSKPKKNIRDYFRSNPRFLIPAYQRGYKWGICGTDGSSAAKSLVIDIKKSIWNG